MPRIHDGSGGLASARATASTRTRLTDPAGSQRPRHPLSVQPWPIEWAFLEGRLERSSNAIAGHLTGRTGRAADSGGGILRFTQIAVNRIVRLLLDRPAHRGW